MSAPSDAERQWGRQWARAATALSEVRARELRALSDDEALAATRELLDLARRGDVPPGRWTWSGLVDFQRLLHRVRS